MARKAFQGNVCEWKGTTFRSTFERDFAKYLDTQGLTWEYEVDSFEWYPKPRKYTPDFKVYNPDGSFYYIETKGRFDQGSRTKMARIKEIHPDVDIRMVFMKASNKVNYKAKKPRTYGDWCDQRGYLWSELTIPEEWIRGKAV